MAFLLSLSPSCPSPPLPFLLLRFSSPHSSPVKPSLTEDSSVSNIVVPEKKISDPAARPSAQDEPVTLEVPLPQSEAEIPLWEVLEGRTGSDTPEQISAEEGAKPSCRG